MRAFSPLVFKLLNVCCMRLVTVAFSIVDREFPGIYPTYLSPVASRKAQPLPIKERELLEGDAAHVGDLLNVFVSPARQIH
jgi:hypothetical protein